MYRVHHFYLNLIFFRCVLCRAKILRLKQHHKIVNAPGSRPPHRSASCHSNSSTASAPASTTATATTAASALPQSASNYSFNKMTSSSSNHSFASGFNFLNLNCISIEIFGSWGIPLTPTASMRSFLLNCC